MKLFYLLTCFFVFSIFIIAQDYWESLAPMPTPRYSLAMEEVNGKLYAIGGHDNGQTLNVVEEYDITNNSWTTKTPLPALRQFPASVVLNGKIIVIAGKLGNSVTNTVEAYDPVSDTWSALAPLNIPRAYPSAVIYNDQIYVFGGDDPINNSISEVEKYEPLLNTWSVISAMTVPRRAMGVTIIGSKVYLIGGTANTINYKRVDIYDIDLNSWSLGPDKLMEGRAIGVESIGNYIFAIGGLIQPPPYAQVEMLDIASGLWTIKTPMPSGRSDFGHSVYNNEIYVVGGYPGNVVALNEVLKYHPDDSIIPVELTTFTATTSNGKVTLNWSTATETNNQGFEIERKIIQSKSSGEWITIGFKEGHGTTTEIQNYQYIDNISDIRATSLSYRLKQIDYDGSYEYSDVVEVTNLAPTEFTLQQNYPNPFNPVTTISYSLPVKSQIELVVYNTLGESIVQLVNEEKEAGRYEIKFDATALPSGIYFYRIQVYAPGRAGIYVDTKKMILLK